MKVTTAARRTLKRKTVQRSLFKVVCYVLTCLISEKGTTSVDVWILSWIQTAVGAGIYGSGSGIYTSGI